VVETVRAYCAPLREAGVDTVILGCTHYPLIAPMLQRMLGPGVA
jgi:glutamate racemase